MRSQRQHRLHLKLAFAALAATASYPLHAATYTWNANSGNISDPNNWLNNTPPTGLDTDQLLFSSPFYTYNINFDNSPNPLGPWILNSLTFSGTTSATVSSTSAQSLQLDGTNPTIIQNSAAPTTLNTPLILNANTTFSGLYVPIPTFLLIGSPPPIQNTFTIISPISGPGSLTKSPDSPILSYQSNTSPTFSGGTLITTAGSTNFALPLVWNYGTDNDTPPDISFGTGNITLDQGAFQLNATSFAGEPDHPVSLTNNIIVTSNGGRLTAFQYGAAAPAVTFSGNIALAGTLVIGASSGTAITPFNTPFGGQGITYSGTITIDQSATTSTFSLFGHPGFTTDTSANANAIITGNIIDDPLGSAENPLTLTTHAAPILIAGNNNTYSHGTNIGSNFLLFFGSSPLLYPGFFNSFQVPVIVAPNSRLGTGNVTIFNLAALQLSALSNLAPGATISGNGLLSLTFDADPALLMASNFVGSISLDTPTFTTPLNLATLGFNPQPSSGFILLNEFYGAPRLGSNTNATYAATSLAPAPDHLYRLGFSSGNLNILNGVITDSGSTPNAADLQGVTLLAANSYSGGTTIEPSNFPTIANAPASLGTGNVTINPTATLILYAPNTYASSATLTVAGTLIIDGNGQIPAGLPPIFLPGSTLNLGDSNATGPTDFYPDALPLNTNNSTVRLLGNISENIGNLSLTGHTVLILPEPAALTVANIIRSPGALLTLDGNAFTDSIGYSLNAPFPIVNNMLPAYVALNDDNGSAGDFATYSANHTLIPVTYAPMPTDAGHSTEIVSVPAAGATLSNDTSIYALLSYGNISASSPNTTLTLTSGGLTVRNLDVPSIQITPNLNFGSSEAILRKDYSGDVTLPGVITAPNGLTAISDGGNWFLSNPNNQISGPITFYGTSLHLSSIGNPADTTPITIDTNYFSGSNSPTLFIDAPITTSRPILFTNAANLQIAPAATLTTSGTINATILTLAGSIAANAINADQLQIATGSHLFLLGPAPSNITTLSIGDPSQPNTPSTLDLGNSAIITKSTIISSWQNLVLTGSNNGITSSTVNADPAHYAIAVVLNSDLQTPFTTFRGQPVTPDSILITAALLGDTNLDNVVDLTDLATVYNNFLFSNPNDSGFTFFRAGGFLWSDGNFDYANTVDLTDLEDTLHPFGFFPTSQSDALADAQSLLNPSPLPEPATLPLLAAATLLLFTKRRPFSPKSIANLNFRPYPCCIVSRSKLH